MMLATIRCAAASVSLVLSDAPNAPSGVIRDRAVPATAMIVKVRVGRLGVTREDDAEHCAPKSRDHDSEGEATGGDRRRGVRPREPCCERDARRFGERGVYLDHGQCDHAGEGSVAQDAPCPTA